MKNTAEDFLIAPRPAPQDPVLHNERSQISIYIWNKPAVRALNIVTELEKADCKRFSPFI